MGRKYGRPMKELDNFQRFYTFLMPKRTASACYSSLEADATGILTYLEEKKKAGESVTVFHLVAAALIRTASQFPQLNRYIYGHQIYARNEYTLAFPISSGEKTLFRKLWLQPEATIETLSQDIQALVMEARGKERDDMDASVDFFVKIPAFLTSFLLKVYLWAVHKGICPKKFVEDDPLFSSTLVSNMGSFGLNAPLHHLYEWGTISVFLTVGKIQKKPIVNKNGEVLVQDRIDFGFTVDERVCGGKTLASALSFFISCIENPWSLDIPPKKVLRE